MPRWNPENKQQWSEIMKQRYLNNQMWSDCEICGARFRISPSDKGRYCSIECSHASHKGKTISEYHKQRISLASFGPRNPNWKGDNIGYFALHQWARKHIEKPDVCPHCKIKPVADLSNISGGYKRTLSDWQWLCRRCHMIYDGRLQPNMNRWKLSPHTPTYSRFIHLDRNLMDQLRNAVERLEAKIQ